MQHDLAPYPDYRTSAASFLGGVPAHWSLCRIKTLFREKEERSGDGLGTLLSLTRAKGIIPQSEASSRIAGAEDLSKYKVCRQGDLVMNRMQAWSGMFAVSSVTGLVSPDYSVFQSVGTGETAYFEYLFKTPFLVDQFAQRSKGIGSGFNRLYTPDFGAIHVCVPSPAEQTAIVRYIHHADGRIRRFIAAKRKLITVLNEQKQGIVQHAITGGLSPAKTERRDSGVPWLGHIPKHWRVRRLKFLAHIKTGGRDTINRVDDGAYPFFVRSQTVERINTYAFDGEAVLTAGDGAGVAKVFHYVKGKFDYHQRVYKFSNFKEITGRFFFRYFSNTLRFEAFRETAKSTVDSLRLPMLQDFPVVIPPPSEQERIVSWIDGETLTLDRAIERATKEIQLTREYRARMIADVVTGKLDVRKVAADLPEEPVESEAESSDLAELVEDPEVVAEETEA